MELKEMFDRWAQFTKEKYTDRQWLLSKWEVDEGIDWPKEKIDIMVQSIIRGLKLKPSHTLVELGCGGGWLSKVLQKHAKIIYGLDFSSHMLTYARKYINKDIFISGEMGRLPFKSESVDRVLSYFVFINIVDDGYIAESLSEIIRVLKKGGRALIGQLPDKNCSKEYDFAKENYFKYCQKNFKLGKKIRSIYQPPIKLFDRKKLISILKTKNIRYDIYDSFNPFYRDKEKKVVSWRFDLMLEKN